ncbi:MAG TPA: winged helix-turn-helix domain-containing protein [Acidobacteriota bacterium]|nr:winged helix-turn-helix domain-containing protein [Acidobacteriota bacterium]HNB71205.1 winged helix-turn-helix domain-containing protein [Acidobacteriota bacterium]HND18372.1 winged helix-turn-helix domain-containing protein [Acidobacteriota bacterium]HNG91695.1 winged helix-turn-helix domain-containing protein [Acidobacteriota bacterium]
MNKQIKHFYEFGLFSIDIGNRLLLRDGEPVALQPKTFDTLLLLVENSGRVLEKNEILDKVWPDTVVEESNLTQNIYILRKVLTDPSSQQKYIETLPRRGYRFIAGVEEVWNEEGADLPVEEHPQATIVVEENQDEVRQERETQPEDTEAALPVAAPELGSPVQHQKMLVAAWIVIGLVIVAFCLWLLGKSNQPAGLQVRSIAVLPFNSLTSDGQDEYLGLGLADALITRLGNVRQITVRPTSAVRKYTRAEQDPVVAGRELKVEAVLDGNIHRVGERIRVTVQLVSVADGHHLWADKFDEQFTNILSVEDSISDRLATALALELTGEERKLLARRYTDNVEAYQLYLKGRYSLDKRTLEGVKKSIEYFEQAIESDQNYALAYAGLADAYSMPDLSGLPPVDSYLKAKTAATKALEIDEGLAEAHLSLAYLRMRHEWDWRNCETELKRAMELNPSIARTHHLYSIYCELMGRPDEAIREMKRAQELDPLSLVMNQNLGTRYYFARQFDQAIAQLHTTLDIDPGYGEAHIGLGQAYVQKGMYPKAILEFQKVTQSNDTPWVLGSLGHVYGLSGNRAEAQKILEQLKAQSTRSYFPPEEIAKVYIGLGEKDQALVWLEKAFEKRSDHLVFVKVDPVWDSLRADPRFTSLMQRIGLTL